MEALAARSPSYHGLKRLHGFSSLGSGPITPSASDYYTWFIDCRRSLITGALLRNSMPLLSSRASQVALVVKHPPANARDMRDIGSTLGREDPLEEEMATHSSILAQKIPWTEELSTHAVV